MGALLIGVLLGDPAIGRISIAIDPAPSRAGRAAVDELAERVGFEPTRAFTLAVFKTAAVSRLATSPCRARERDAPRSMRQDQARVFCPVESTEYPTLPRRTGIGPRRGAKTSGQLWGGSTMIPRLLAPLGDALYANATATRFQHPALDAEPCAGPFMDRALRIHCLGLRPLPGTWDRRNGLDRGRRIHHGERFPVGPTRRTTRASGSSRRILDGQPRGDERAVSYLRRGYRVRDRRRAPAGPGFDHVPGSTGHTAPPR